MRQDIRERLIQVAKAKRLITYKELGEEFNIPAWWRQLGRILGDICRYELANKRPYISGIVVRQDTRRPGPGFFKFPDMDRSRPWEFYRDEVWDYWSKSQMCGAETKKGCERPEKLKGEPEECSPEQIEECHGEAIEHPCVKKE